MSPLRRQVQYEEQEWQSMAMLENVHNKFYVVWYVYENITEKGCYLVAQYQ